ncbi:MAG: glycosyltransferase family 39 protein [Sporolactobacillus sp.]
MKRLRNIRWDFYFIAILLLSAFLNLFLLASASTNEFYTVAVKSMMTNFHNFFFASFDPAGFITVDKPPVSLWMQVLSAKLFGFSNVSVLLPSAVAAVVSTALVYRMVKKKAGTVAAFIAGLAMAFTPIFVAISRTNNTDGVMILTLVLAAWAIFKAEASGKLRWLLISVAFVGIGYNAKMLEAYMIVPAIYLFYLVAVKTNWKKKVIHLAAATVVLLAVSLSWSLAVDATPAKDRPYVGGSTTNSELNLAFGYNGVSRLTGQRQSGKTEKMTTDRSRSGFTPPSGFSREGGRSFGFNREGNPSFGADSAGRTGEHAGRLGGAAGGNMFNTGTAGPLRLFQKQLSAQASWLLPFVLFGIVAIVADFVRRRRLSQQHTFTLFWLAWLLPEMAFFSVAGFFHQYYLSIMAAPIGALVGIGSAFMIREFLKKDGRTWESFLLPAAFAATLLFEALIFAQNSIDSLWVFLLICAAVLSLAFGLLWRTSEQERMKKAIIGTSLAAMLAPAVYWTVPSVFNQSGASTPVAGPSSTQTGFGAGGMSGSGKAFGFGAGGGETPSGMGASEGSFTRRFAGGGARQGGGEQLNTKLLNYLRKHYNGEKFILAVPSAQSAYAIMMKTNYAVMAMGGFGGSDPALTLSKLEQMVKDGQVKYFLLSGDRMGSAASSVTSWIKKNCGIVPASEWSDTSSSSSRLSGFGNMGSGTLYVYHQQ